jgi:tetratricopeptide (TPR) repeat protein
LAVPGVDPAGVSTPDELAVCLDGLRRRRGLSYEAMATAAEKLRALPGGQRREPLAKSTVGEIVTGKRPPSKDKLLTFLAVCGIAPADRVQWLAAWERAATAGLSRPAGGVRVRDAGPRQLGVHAAIHVESAPGELPVYVPRDIDASLRAALGVGAQQGCFVLLVGGSSVGKTRTLYEAVLDVLPDWWLVHPDPDSPDPVRVLAAAPVPRTVVWLDELQRYLGGSLTAGSIRSLLRGGTVLAATMWPDEYGIRILPRQSEGEDPHGAARELLELAKVFDLSGEFTAAEQIRARDLAPSDGRLRAALAVSDGGMTQVLAAGPQLVRRWEQAPPYAKAVITAAVDARRVGVISPLPRGLLAEAASGYLTAAQRASAQDDWLDRALDYAATPLHGAACALTPVASGKLMGRVDGYVAADYLLQHGRRTRRTVCPPLTLWESCLTGLGNTPDLLAVGGAARSRLLLGLAERFYRAAASIPDAAWSLSELLRAQGRTTEAEQILRAALSRGDPYAATALGSLLMASGRVAEAERLLHGELAAGKPYTRRTLAILLERQGRFEEAEAILRDGVAAQDPDSPQRLGFLLMRELGRPDEAERVLRAAVAARRPEVVVPLAFLLANQGRDDEAEQILRDGVAAGDPYARFRLAGLLQRLGRMAEAEQTCREGIAAGDPMARLAFDRLLRQQERFEEAEQTWREGVINGERDAPRYLAELLRDQGQLEEAERVLRDGIAAGHDLAADHLIYFLEGLGRVDEVRHLQRYGLNLDATPIGLPRETGLGSHPDRLGPAGE